MQQRQLRLGDILDDYCPRALRLTNHAIVALVGADVKQTRCTTCDTEHQYKHAKVPRQRKKTDAAALQGAAVAGAPKKVPHAAEITEQVPEPAIVAPPAAVPADVVASASAGEREHDDGVDGERAEDDEERHENPGPAEEGPVHRPLIRAQLPRQEGQPPAARPA